MAVLCMLYKMRCNPMHPLYDALPGPCVPLRVTRGAVVAHRYTLKRLLAVGPRSTARLLLPCQYLCGTILVTAYSMVCDCLILREMPMPFYWSICYSSFVTYCLAFLFFHSLGWYCGAWVIGLIIIIMKKGRQCKAGRE